MNYRTKLLLSFCTLLVSIFVAAYISYWGSQQAFYHIERSRLAHNTLEVHLRLSSETYRAFKHLADTLFIKDQSAREEIDALKRNLEASLNDLRLSLAEEIAFVSEDEKQAEKDELGRVALIERKIGQILSEFDDVNRLKANGQEKLAWMKLTDVLDKSIDQGFGELVNTAIADETSEVEEIDRKAAALVSQVQTASRALAYFAAAFALISFYFLFKSFQKPLQALVEGTDTLARGNLSHRIDVKGNDEFAYLGRHFNQMAEDLEMQSQELKIAKTKLESEVSKQTSELERAYKALEENDNARRSFFADISHELRTPLTIIRGEAEVTLRGGDKTSDEYKKSLEKILQKTTHTASLVDDLLFIARNDASNVHMKFQTVALDNILSAVCEDANIIASKKSVQIDYQKRTTAAFVLGDPGRLSQLFLILIDNAIRYSNPNSSIAVCLDSDEESGRVQVSDKGVGIAENELDRIFQRFYRGHNANEQNAEGTGIGLPVAKAIVEAHGGQIKIDSIEEKGTTVLVALPIIQEESQRV